MTDYKCGHKTDGLVLINSDTLSLATYFTWAEDKGVNGSRELCFDCYCKDIEVNKK